MSCDVAGGWLEVDKGAPSIHFNGIPDTLYVEKAQDQKRCRVLLLGFPFLMYIFVSASDCQYFFLWVDLFNHFLTFFRLILSSSYPI